MTPVSVQELIDKLNGKYTGRGVCDERHKMIEYRFDEQKRLVLAVLTLQVTTILGAVIKWVVM